MSKEDIKAVDTPSQQKALEAFVRNQTPKWISQVLKTQFIDIPLEDLFANCWILGRIADTCNAILLQKTYSIPSQQLGVRPYRAIINDIEHFHALCQTLSISHDSRITLADVEQRRAGVRIGLCLWDISTAMRDRGHVVSIPDFAPAAEKFAQLRHSMPRETNKTRIEQFEHSAGNSPVKIPHKPHLIAPLSPAKNDDILAAQSTLSSPANRTTTTATDMTSDNTPHDQMNTHILRMQKDPISLHGWLHHSDNAGMTIQHHQQRENGENDAWRSPTLLKNTSSISNGAAQTHILDGEGKNVQDDDKKKAPPAFIADADGIAAAADVGLDVLQSILTPEISKPKHTQLINAIMRSDPGNGGDMTSSSSAKRSLDMDMSSPLKGSVRYVKVISQSARKNNEQKIDGGGWWKLPLSAVVGAVAAVAAVGLAGALRNEGRSGGKRGGGVTHQGRW